MHNLIIISITIIIMLQKMNLYEKNEVFMGL